MKKVIKKSTLYKLYLTHTDKEIAEKLGCSLRTVKYLFKKMGFKGKSKNKILVLDDEEFDKIIKGEEIEFTINDKIKEDNNGTNNNNFIDEI